MPQSASNPPAPSPAMRELLAQPAWIRDLAHSLVSDPALAEDVVQASWLAALRSDSKGVRSPRSWFARILRNQVRRHRRATVLREEREREAARPEALPSTADCVAELSLQHDVTARVLALDQIYREVLILRFHRGLDRREAARRLGISPNTLDSRQQKALALLRERLDGQYGDRANWCAALAPLLAGGPSLGAGVETVGRGFLQSAGAHGAGGTLMLIRSHPYMVLTTLALISAIPLVPALLVEEAPSRGALEPSAAVEFARGEEGDGLFAAPEPPGASARVAVAAETEDRTYAGHLVDERGRPLADARIGWIPGEAEAGRIEGSAYTFDGIRRDFAPVVETTTDRHGAFALTPIPAGGGGGPMLLDGGDRFLLGVGRRITEKGERENVLVAARVVELGIRVLDEDGAPVPRAVISMPIAFAGIRDLPFRLLAEPHMMSGPHRPTDMQGAVRIPDVPYYPGSVLSVRGRNRDEFQVEVVPVPDRSTDALVVTLRRGQPRPDLSAGVVSPAGLLKNPPPTALAKGRVVDSVGAPVEGALVLLDGIGATTTSDGGFQLFYVVPSAGTESNLVIAKPGQPPFLEDIELWHPRFAEGETVDIPLGGVPPLSIAGRIEAGEQDCSGFRIELLDGRPIDRMELILADLGLADFSLGDLPPSDFSLERLCAERNEPVVVDEEGRFEFTGLLPRDYRLLVWNADGSTIFESVPIAAGTRNAEITTPEVVHRSPITVRAIDRRGVPLRGATITVTTCSDAQRWIEGAVPFPASTAVVDEKGRAEFRNLPRCGVTLTVGGEELEETSLLVPCSNRAESIDIVAPRLHFFRPRSLDRDDADSAQVVDAAGEPLLLTYFTVHGNKLSQFSLFRGPCGFPDFLAGDRAVELLLYRGDELLRRMPLAVTTAHGINQF